jgi:hypothetical protein
MVIVVCRIGHRGFAIGRYKSITQYFEIHRTTDPALLLRGLLKERLKDKDGACNDLRKADSMGNADATLKIMEICN